MELKAAMACVTVSVGPGTSTADASETTPSLRPVGKRIWGPPACKGLPRLVTLHSTRPYYKESWYASNYKDLRDFLGLLATSVKLLWIWRSWIRRLVPKNIKCTRRTTSRVARAIMSAQETTPGQAASRLVLIVLIRSWPWIVRFGPASISAWFPGVLNIRMDASQPCRVTVQSKQLYIVSGFYMIKLSCIWCCISPCILFAQPHLEPNKVWAPRDQEVWTLILQGATQLKLCCVL